MKSTPSKEVLSEDRIAEILAKVAQRENPPAEVANAVRARVHQAWQASLQERRGQRRRFTVLASAAGLLLVLGLGLFMQQHTPAPVVLATLGQQLNSVEYRRAGGAWQPVEQGVSPGLLAGDQLRTAAGSFAAFSTEQGLRVRLDQSSELRLLSEREVFLSKGAVYVNAEGESQLTVATAAGIARDIGTKFEVRVMPQGWQVQVRDGQVLIEDKRSGSAVANAGERLQLAADAPPERQAVSAADASWEWTH
ncbi:MAG: ferric-dicitrate binding protein FerR (iron transport regulator), partial [Halieaceae bacterium]